MFRVGDRVVCIKESEWANGLGPQLGREYTISAVGTSAGMSVVGVVELQDGYVNWFSHRFKDAISAFYDGKREAFRTEWEKLQAMRAAGASPEELRRQEEIAYQAGDCGD